MHHTAFVPHSWVLPNRQHSRTTACPLMSDRGYLLIQAFFLLGICYDPNLSNPARTVPVQKYIVKSKRLHMGACQETQLAN